VTSTSPRAPERHDRRRWYDEGFYERTTFAEHLERGAASFPDAAMHFVGGPEPRTVTLDDMNRSSRRVARGLAGLGVGPGTRVAVWVPNWIEGVLATQATWLLGGTVVPIIHIYGPREVGHILAQSGAAVLVVPDSWRSIDYLERLSAMQIPDTLRHTVVIGDRLPDGAHRWADIAGGEPLATADLPRTDPDDVSLVIYTSGTTADPKGVRHSTNTLVAEIKTGLRDESAGPGTALGAFPAGHIAGVLTVLRMLLRGTSTVLMDQWDPALAARLVEQHAVTGTAGAPIHLATMLDEARRNGNDLSTLTGYMCGAASVPPALMARADAEGIPVYRGYGSSEHPVISSGRPEDPIDKRARTDGRLTAGTSIRLLDDDGNEVPTGQPGEIVSIGPELFLGYTDPALDAESFTADGWFRTGDIGVMDEDGYLTITDRKKDVIIRGGENIASKEVEDILALHPAILEAAVVGRPDPTYGEKVAAFVRVAEGASITIEDLLAHFARHGAARQKTPEFLRVVDDLPRAPSGKVRKVELRDRLRRELSDGTDGP
jgi:acyl-CoA synthetase (AMP-forming)/AMP-acid ligase II